MANRRVIVPPGFEEQYELWQLAPAVQVDNMLYASGQLGMARDGSFPVNAEDQVVNAFESIKAVLEHAGGSLADIVEMTSFHVGLADQLGAFATVRDRYLSEPYPAQTAIGVAELGLPGALIEIKVTAVIDS